jgi:predicted kinase
MINFSKWMEAKEAKKIFVLVGPPSVGKSHWIKKTFEGKDPYVINRDDIVAKVASQIGWTYDEMYMPPSKEAKEGDFDIKYGTVVQSPPHMTWQPLSYDKVVEANEQVQDLFDKRMASAHPSGKDIVVDMTNMDAKDRQDALSSIEGAIAGEYQKIAVVFKFKGAEDIIKKVAKKRAAQALERGESKTIPPEAFDRIFQDFQEVDPSEGFDQVVSVDNINALMKLGIDEQQP